MALVFTRERLQWEVRTLAKFPGQRGSNTI